MSNLSRKKIKNLHFFIFTLLTNKNAQKNMNDIEKGTLKKTWKSFYQFGNSLESLILGSFEKLKTTPSQPN